MLRRARKDDLGPRVDPRGEFEEPGHDLHHGLAGDDGVDDFHEGEGHLGDLVVEAGDAAAPADDGGDGAGVAFDGVDVGVWGGEDVVEEDFGFVALDCAVGFYGLRADDGVLE